MKKATARRTKGSGGITQDATGVWRVDVEVSRDAVTGRRRRVSRTVRGSRKDAEMVAAKLKLADHEQRLVTGKTSAKSVGEAMERYLAAVESGSIEMAPSTVVTCRSAIKTMTATELSDGKEFGRIPLSRLTWRQIEDLYAVLAKAGKGTSWIRRCATVLTQSLEYGRKRGLLESNPAKDAQRPKTKRTKPYSPKANEVRDAIACATERDPEMADMARLLASTGMRRGELLALRWNDINFEAQEVNVQAALVDGGKGIGIVRKATKNSDWRDVPLTDSAAEALRRQRDRQPEGLQPNDYVFIGDYRDRSPVRPDRLSKRWPAASGNPQITLLHLRHFAATTMLDAGESYRTVADILGNSENTLRLHYDGRTDTKKREAVQALEID